MNMNMGGYGGYSDKSQFTTNCNFINVSSPQQVKEFNVKAGDKIYFLDVSRPLQYVKEADNMGVCSISCCELKPIDFNSLFATPTSENAVSKDDFKAFMDSINRRFEALEHQNQRFENKSRKQFNGGKKNA